MACKRLIVFDLDGTFVDSLPDLQATLNRILYSNGLQPLSLEAVRPMVGHGAKHMLDQGFKASDVHLSEADLELYFDHFIADYSENNAVFTRPFPYLIEAVNTLKSQGWAFSICTNKLEKLAHGLLRKLDLLHFFQVIAGSDTYGVKKPDPQHLIKTIRQSGHEPEYTVMVGDSYPDIAAAQSAQIPIIAMRLGYSDKPLESFKPDYILDDYRHFMPTLQMISRKW